MIKMKPKIIIVGAGFAGLSALIKLIRSKIDADVKALMEKDSKLSYGEAYDKVASA